MPSHHRQSSAVFFCFLALGVALVCGQSCDVTLGAFQLDVVSQVSIAKNYFQKEGIHLCTAQVFTSLAGYTNLQNGTYDILLAAVDNTYWRRYTLQPPLNFTVAAGSDMGVGYVVLAHHNYTLETLTGTTYAADGPETGFIRMAFEMARLSGVDISTLSNVSGFNNDQRNSLANGDVVNGKTAQFALQALLYGIPEFYEPQWPNLVTIGKLKDFVWPISGSVYNVRPDAQSNPAQFEKLRRFFRGLLRGYLYATKKNNRHKVIHIISETMGISESIAGKIFELSINPGIAELTGINPFMVPSKRGIFNNGVFRYNQNAGPVPATVNLDPAPGELVDLRALDAAMDDLSIGDAFECYNSNFVNCED